MNPLMQRAFNVTILVGLIGGLAWTCGTSPSQSLVVSIHGPSLIQPGSQAHFTLTATRSDGTIEDVTSQATWHATPLDVMSVTAPGTIVGLVNGQATVIAVYEQHPATLAVVVLAPDASFRVSGSVSTVHGSSIRGATVTATAGETTIAQTQTDLSGLYAFPSLAGRITLQASFADATSMPKPLTVTSDTPNVNFSMSPPFANVNIAGSWIATFTPAPDCAALLPADTRQRTYALLVTPTNTTPTATFYTSPGSGVPLAFEVDVFGSEVSILISNLDYYGVLTGGILDRLSPTRWLNLFGTIELTATPSTMAGVFNGEFDYYETLAAAAPSLSDQPTASCKGSGTGIFQRATSAASAKRIR